MRAAISHRALHLRLYVHSLPKATAKMALLASTFTMPHHLKVLTILSSLFTILTFLCLSAIPERRETCSFYAAGDCSKGEACNFAHARTDSGVKSPAVLSALSTPSLNEISRDMSHSSESTSTSPDSDATLNEPDSRGLLLQVPDRREAEQSPLSSHGSTSSGKQTNSIA